MNPEKTKELETLIATWATENKILSAGDVMEVKVNIISRPLVKVEMKQENHLDEMPLSELEFSVRAQHCLNNANLHKVGDLRTKTRDQMMKYRSFGRKSLREVQEKLGAFGITVDWVDPKANARPVS